jgi:hypothetical protein
MAARSRSNWLPTAHTGSAYAGPAGDFRLRRAATAAYDRVVIDESTPAATVAAATSSSSPATPVIDQDGPPARVAQRYSVPLRIRLGRLRGH